MSTVTLRYKPQHASTEVASVRWSPLLAALVWSAVSAAAWTVMVGAGLALG